MLRNLISVLLLLACSAAAETDIHGFGSVRAGKMLPKGENPKLVDMYASDGLIWRDETLFALQTTTDLQESLRVTIQMMAKGSDDFSAKMSLAFLSYQLNPDMQINFGRIANPLFAQSDFQYVRYAHDYARLPKAVYWNFDFETIEGLSFEHKATVNDFAVKYRLITGDFSGKTFKSVRPEGVPIKLHNIVNGYLELSRDYWTVFGGAMQANGDGTAIDEQLIFPLVLPALANTNASPTEKQQLLDTLSMSKRARYYYFGGRLQFGDWKIEGEKTNYGILDSADPRNTAHYVAVSKRFDPFILTYHHEWSMQDINDLGFLRDITNPILRQIGTQVYQRLATPNRFSMDVLTLRYDLQPGVSFKIDYLQGRDRQPKVGEFRGFSFGLDFVF